MVYYLMFFAAGFAGSFHCVGMCGGFACALGHDPHGQATTALRHVLYNLVIWNASSSHYMIARISLDRGERLWRLQA